MRTKEMVVGFAFDKALLQVLLILKNKPEWQKGLFNGVGGKVEAGEDSLTAMIREFKEETGLSMCTWHYVATMTGDLPSDDVWKVHVFATRGDLHQAFSPTDELVAIWYVNQLPPNMIPNLKWLIPLCKDVLHNGSPKDVVVRY